MANNTYVVKVPNPNGEFTSYTAVISPRLGLCAVSGIGRDHDGAFGDDIRTSFHQMAGTLDSIYGHHKEYDQLKYGSIWNEPKDFAMGVKEGDQSVVGFWDRQERSTLPDSLDSIMLDVRAIASSSTYLVLRYEFANFAQCKKDTDRSGL